MSQFFTDRSRVLSYWNCPRQRYLGYHFAGHGIAKQQLSIPLSSGTFIHLGLAALLNGASTDDAVAVATEGYWEAAQQALRAAKIPNEHYLYTITEQTALTEALIRVYALRGLPALLSNYKVLGVETEYTFELAPGVVFMARLDGELLNLESGEVEVLSFKTDSGKHLDSKIRDARIDLQGLSEPEAYYRVHGILPFAVKMEWLLKGEHKAGSDGLKRQESHLVRPYRRFTPRGIEYAWQYYWACPGAPHQLQKADGKTWTCKGDGKLHGLGPTWERCNIWETMPIKEWIATLDAREVQPEIEEDALDACLYLPEPIYRVSAERERAMNQVAMQEGRIKEDIAYCAGLGNAAVGRCFPQHSTACHNFFGGDCQFTEICYAADEAAILAGGVPEGYVPRTPHHEPELVQIQSQK
jgi:hypothetical protein